MAEDNHVVLITTDHTAADLASMALLVQEIGALYVLHGDEAASGLPALEIQYADFAAWQREFGKSGWPPRWSTGGKPWTASPGR